MEFLHLLCIIMTFWENIGARSHNAKKQFYRIFITIFCRAALVNPLILETEEEKRIFQKGEGMQIKAEIIVTDCTAVYFLVWLIVKYNQQSGST